MRFKAMVHVVVVAAHIVHMSNVIKVFRKKRKAKEIPSRFATSKIIKAL